MSIFQAKEWWGVKAGENEEFDGAHLCVANIDNEKGPKDKIILASYSGILRIYSPKSRKYRVEDLLYENNFGMPIIQVKAGRFLPNSPDLALAILFFKKVLVYSFTTLQQGGIAGKLVYEMTLQRNAFNMAVGPFGGIKNRDHIAVQSCDGAIMVFEHSQMSCICQLSDFLLPSPIVYHRILDGILLQNSSMEIEFYNYSSLVSFANSQKEGKKLIPEWAVNIGEQAVELEVFPRNASNVDIIVLTETMLLVLSQKGSIISQKQFDYLPANICFYDKASGSMISPDDVRDKSSMSYIISTFVNHILIYNDMQVVWAARTDHICHGLKIGSFDNQPGLICTISDTGNVQVLFLGTEPPQTSIAVAVDQKPIKYTELEQDYTRYATEISKKESSGKSAVEEPTEKLTIRVNFVNLTKSHEFVDNSELLFKDDLARVINAQFRMLITFNGIKATDITLRLELPRNLQTDNPSFFIESLRGGQNPFPIDFLVYCSNQLNPSHKVAKVFASYFSHTESKGRVSKEPRTSFWEFELPFMLQARLVPPIKTADFKLTLNLDKELPPTQDLFADCVEGNAEDQQFLAHPNVVSFSLCNGIDATLVIAKSSSKFRIQSSRFEGLWLLLYEICARIRQFYDKQGGCVISFTDSLPLQDFFQVIDEHFELRKRLTKAKEELEQRANQFRIIQKRLLTRFKERNPTPMNSLDQLSQQSVQEIIASSMALEEVQQQLSYCSNRLSLSVMLVNYLVKLRFNLADTAYNYLNCYVSPNVIGDDADLGWEEMTNSCVAFAIKLVTGKVSSQDPGNNQPSKVEDLAKFKKHLTILYDKISKGAELNPSATK